MQHSRAARAAALAYRPARRPLQAPSQSSRSHAPPRPKTEEQDVPQPDKLLDALVGQGSYGKVYTVRRSDGTIDMQTVIKVQLVAENQHNDVQREYDLAYVFGNLGIGPRVFETMRGFRQETQEEHDNRLRRARKAEKRAATDVATDPDEDDPHVSPTPSMLWFAWYAMERFDGSVDKFFRSRVPRSADVAALEKQIGDCIDTMYDNGYMCVDIKPGNSLYRVKSDGKLHFVLTDFDGNFCRTIRGNSNATPHDTSPHVASRLESAPSDVHPDMLKLATRVLYAWMCFMYCKYRNRQNVVVFREHAKEFFDKVRVPPQTQCARSPPTWSLQKLVQPGMAMQLLHYYVHCTPRHVQTFLDAIQYDAHKKEGVIQDWSSTSSPARHRTA